MESHIGLALICAAFAIIGFSLRFLWRSYVRAHYMQALWAKRLDSLSVADWQAASRHLTKTEFNHLLQVANEHSVGRRMGALAPTLRDVIVQFHVNKN